MKHGFPVALAGATVMVAILAAYAQASASPSTKATEIINTVAVNSDGQPVNGYHDITVGQTVPDQSDCTEPSPAAVSKNIYQCSPAYYDADVCWPASNLDLLCMNDPWAKELHRIRARNPLGPVSPSASPTPVALLLDDGTHCRLRNGGAWGHRYDNLQAYYGCGDSPGLTVLGPQGADPIDRSSPTWTVKVGADDATDPSSPPPVTHSVQTAWFAADHG